MNSCVKDKKSVKNTGFSVFMWTPCNEDAVALYTYQSPDPNHITLIAGDKLTIFEKCKGWARVKCKTTSCVGICPLNRLAPEYKLYQIEAKELVRFVFSKYLTTARRANEKDYLVMGYVSDFLLNRIRSIPEFIDKTRNAIFQNQYPYNTHKLLRCKDGEVRRTHDFFGYRQTSDENFEDQFSKTVSLIVTTNLCFSREVLIKPMIYNLSKKMSISAPSDILLPPHYSLPTIIHFQNIEPDFKNLALIIRFFNVQKYEEDTGNEYLGVSCNRIADLDFSTNNNAQFIIQIFQDDTEMMSDLHERILANEPLAMACSAVLSNILLIETPGQAEILDNSIQTLGYPPNIGPSFHMNIMTFRIGMLKQHSSLKKTRVVVHLIDTEHKGFLPCFVNGNMTHYSSMVQRGSLDMLYDDYFSISLDGLIPKSSTLVFEVYRILNNGTQYLSTYALYPLTTPTGEINVSTAELILRKPATANMEPEDFLKEADTTKLGGTIEISASICSTRYTSDPIVYQLLSSKEPEKITTYLQKADTTKIVEMQLFLGPIITNLCEMIPDPHALEALTRVFEIISRSRVHSFPVFFKEALKTTFVQSHPWMASIHFLILANLKSALNDPEQAKDACRCMNYFLELIAASLKLNREMKQHVDDDTFQQPLEDIIKKLCEIVQGDQQVNKSFVLQSFPLLVGVLTQVFDRQQAFCLVNLFFSAVEVSDVSPLMKTRLYNGIFDTTFYSDERNRRAVEPFIFKALSAMKDTFYSGGDRSAFSLIEKMFYKELSSSTVFKADPYSYFLPYVIDTEFCFSLLYFLKKEQIAKVIQSQEDPLSFYMKLLSRFKCDNLPSYLFFVMPSIFYNVVSLCQLKEFDFIRTVLSEVTNCIATFYSDFTSSVAKYSPCDLILFQRIYNFNLDPISALLPTLIKSIPYENRFNSYALLPLFDFYINQTNEQTRHMVAEGVFLVLDADKRTTGNFQRSENAIIHNMDKVSMNHRMTDLHKCFSTAKSMFKPITKEIDSFFKKLDQLADFMADIGQYPTEPIFEDEVCTAILSVLQHNSEPTIILHFTSKLYAFHVMLGNHVEAAETLMYAARTIDWNDEEVIVPGHGFLEQKKNQRKISMMEKAATLYIQGEFWEKALSILQELFDYYKVDHIEELERITKLMAKCWRLISHKERNVLSRFYGVRFYGNGFSQYFRNKLFIYRRGGFFMNDQMMQELNDKFSAMHVKVDPKPPQDLKPDELYIHVFNCKPRDIKTFDPEDPPMQRMTRLVSNVQDFYSETPVRKKNTKGYGEFAEWFREIRKFHTQQPLEGILRRSEVEKESPMIEWPPVECAVRDTNAKTLELIQRACEYWRCLRLDIDFDPNAVSSFSMLLNGIVNAAVNGGTAIFQATFLEGPMADESECRKFATQLKNALEDQLKAVKFALAIHFEVCPPAYFALHENIQQSFEEMKKMMQRVLGEKEIDSNLHNFGTLPSLEFLEKKLEGY